ncbi:MAG: hypothetical protein HXY40_02170 [Chloroflexi bacterium]|nr:hypothetical protein [Chloroflexota bacterium]
MSHPERLLMRLDAIGQALARSGHGLALLALGSVGVEQARLDAYSDLDFFAIVEPGYKRVFIDDLGWLSAICPIAYAFQNTVDGCKLLFDDAIFAEFAVFEPHELAQIPFPKGRFVWRAPGFDQALGTPKPTQPQQRTTEWLLGEALTNLYIGLGRFRRGEKLSAAYFIQTYAVARIIDLAPQIEVAQPAFRDEFAGERRFEQRFPGIAAHLPRFMQGYEGSPECARAILEFLEQYFAVNPAIKAEILKLCAG